MIRQLEIEVATSGRGTYEITQDARACVAQAELRAGLLNAFIQHTSASLLLCENADPQVRRDLEVWLARVVPDGDRDFRHTAEGPDDMPAHVRSALLVTSLSIPVREGRLELGVWQGLYLYEHRLAAHRRHVLFTLTG